MNKEEWDKEENIIFEKFKNSLNKCKNFIEAKLLVLREAPPVDTPGRKYYSNLGTFLTSFDTIPNNASKEEKLLYKDFIERLDNTGQLKPGEGKRIIDKLNNDIKKNSY